MPVEDHATHERVKIDSGFRYGCHSERNLRGRRDGYMAPNGYALGSHGDTREIQMVYVPDNSSRECRGGWNPLDNGCNGCARRGSAEAYDQKVRNAA